MNAHRWNLAGLLVLLTAIAIDQPVVAKIFRFRRINTTAMADKSTVKAIVDLDAVTCAEGSTACCDSTESNDANACCNLHFVSAEVFVPETILGDTDGNGTICATEAVSVLNDEAIKEALFALTISEQKDYLMSFAAEIRSQIDQLAATHGTWKWRFALRSAAKMGLTAPEAEAIAVAWLN